jgi:hypothetical protein
MSNVPLSALDAYRAGYAAGYFRGRISVLTGEEYDERTDVERGEIAEETADGTALVDPWDNEKGTTE